MERVVVLPDSVDTIRAEKAKVLPVKEENRPDAVVRRVDAVKVDRVVMFPVAVEKFIFFERREERRRVLPFKEDAEIDNATMVPPVREEKKVLFVFKRGMVPVEVVILLPFMVE